MDSSRPRPASLIRLRVGLRPFVLPLWVVLVAALAGPARAEDALVLQNGREITGTVLEETADHVKLGIGGGAITYPRAMVKEIRRGSDAAPDVADAAEPPAGPPVREEHALLYRDGERAGTRVFRALERADGMQFEEQITFLDADGRPSLRVFTVERCDRAFRPTFLQVQETSAGDGGEGTLDGAEGGASLSRLEVVGDRLHVSVTRDGDTREETVRMPPEARLPFGAREEFLRTSAALDGAHVYDVYDVRARRFVSVHYREGGEKSVQLAGDAGTRADVIVRVVKRTRGDRDEVEWIGADLQAVMTELNGESLRAMPAPRTVLDAVQDGDRDRVTGPDSVARSRYADPVAGFSIGKPDPSWTFDEPAIPGASGLVSVRSRALGASVDVLRDEAVTSDVTLERAAAALQRLLRVHSREFRMLSDGYEDVGGGRRYRLEATAVTKGERTRTLAHVYVRDGRVYRLLAACPEAAFDAARADLERILATFEIANARD